MEDSVGEKQKQREFALTSVAELYSVASGSPGIARFGSDGYVAMLQIHHESQQIALSVDLRTAQLFKLGPVQSVCIVEGSDGGKETSFSRAVAVQFKNEEESGAFHCEFQQWKKEANVKGAALEIRGNLIDRLVSSDKVAHQRRPSLCLHVIILL